MRCETVWRLCVCVYHGVCLAVCGDDGGHSDKDVDAAHQGLGTERHIAP